MPPSDARKQTVGFGEVDFGTNRVVAPMHRALSGGHRLNGVFMAFGEPIKPGVWLKEAQLTDVAPTALHLAGLPVPEDMDGSVLLDALRTEYADPASIRHGPPASRDDESGGEIIIYIYKFYFVFIFIFVVLFLNCIVESGFSDDVDGESPLTTFIL